MTNRHDFRLDEKLGLDRVESAAYVGVSPALFDVMVADGRYPQPKEQNGRNTWDREALATAFRALPNRAGKPAANVVQPEGNPWNRGKGNAA